MKPEDPMNEGPDGLTGIDEDLRKAAQTVAEALIYFPEANDHRSLSLFDVNYTFATVRGAQEALIDGRFRLVRALVTFAYAERAKAATKQLATALIGDA